MKPRNKMVSKTIAIAAAIAAFAMPLCNAFADTESTFTDVSADAYYSESVAWAVDEGITTGITDALFSPDTPCTRAQILTFIWRAEGSPRSTLATISFSDLDEDAYYYEAVRWAVEKGITVGTSRNAFSPDDYVTRGQALTFLYRNAGSPAVSSGNVFSDVSSVMYYAVPVQWAAAKGITTGAGSGMFIPESNCTRAEIVTFLYRAYS